MALVLHDRVKQTTTSTGTGTINLAGAATGFTTFVAGIGNSNTTYYCIAHQSASEFEVGIGTVTDASPDTITGRTNANVFVSSNSNNMVDFSAGTKDVFCTQPASKAVFLDSSGNLVINGVSYGNAIANRFVFTASAGQSAFTGNDDNGATLSFGSFAQVYLNGSLLKLTTDYAVSSGNTVTLQGVTASLNDILEVIDFNNFNAANTLIPTNNLNDVASASTARTNLGLGDAATKTVGIASGNVPNFAASVADDDFLKIDGTTVEGRSAAEVLSDIGGQASLTFGIANTNTVKIDHASVADDDYARFTASGLEGRSAAEVLSDIGAAKPNFTRVSSTNSGGQATKYIKVATLDTSTPSSSNSTFVFHLLLEGRGVLRGASQFKVHIRTGDQASITSVVIEQDHNNQHSYYDVDSFKFFWNSQSDSELWFKLPNTSHTSYQELDAKLILAANVDATYTSGQDDVTIHTSQSWTTSAPSGTNEITAEWIKKKFDSIDVNTISSATDNGNLNLTPNGTGKVLASTTPFFSNFLGSFSVSDASPLSTGTIFSDTYDIYDIYLQNIMPVTDDVLLILRLEDTSGGQLGAYNYSYYVGYVGSFASDGLQSDTRYDAVGTSWTISGQDEFSVGNESDEGFSCLVRLYNTRNDFPAIARIFPNYMSVDGYFCTSYFDVLGSLYTTTTVGGARIFFSSGNISSGTMSVYGLKSGA